MNRKQRRAAARDSLGIGEPINGDQGEALTGIIETFLKANLGHVQPFALLVSNGEQIRVIGNCGEEVLVSMLEIVGCVPHTAVTAGKLSDPAAGSA